MIPQTVAAALGKRAARIVERVAPLPSYVAHGFTETSLFVEQCRYRARRDNLYRTVFWRLAAKSGYAK